MRISFSKILLFILTLVSVFSIAGAANMAYADPPEDEDQEREVVEIEPEADPASTGCVDDCGLVEQYAIPFLNFLGAVVGLVVTISIVVGGIQYASSADDPQKVAAAKSRIANAVIALVAFLFLYGFLQWVVPGGFI